MNRNLLKWILIAAVILGAAGYLILSESPTDKKSSRPKGKKEQKEQIVVGHSKAFKIEPVEGITISAAEDALDKDRKITLTPVSDEKYDEVCEAFSKQDIKPLFVFDYHAGLKPDESFPGDVNFDVDLDQLGIPRNLQDRVCVYRYTSGESGGSYRYLTQYQKGHIQFSGNQNSLLVLVINPLLYHAVKLTAAKAVLSTIWELADAEFKHVPASVYFASNYSTISLPIPDKHGDFILTFRFSDTENPDGYKAFVALGEKIASLEEKAKNQYEDKVKEEVEKEQEGYSVWQKIFSKKQVQAIRENIHYEEILQDLINEDPVLKAYNEDPVSQLPKSVQAFIGYVKQANKYLDDKGVHPLDREFYVYLVTNTVLGADNFGVANKVPGGKCYLLLNYDKYNGDSENPSLNQSRREGVLLTSVHELFHNRQKLYYCVFSMSSYAAEATAVAMEWDAARDFYRDGVITTDPSTFDGQDNLSLTKRKEFQIFNVPFDKITKKASGVDVGYTLSLPIEDIRKNAGKEDKVSMAAFVRNYSVYGPHTIGWAGWLKKSLEINDDELDKGWLYFGEKNMGVIVSKQATIMDNTPGDVFASKIIKPTLEQPIVHLKELAKAQDYTVHSYEIDLPTNGLPGKRNITEFARVFIINKSKENNPCVSFYFDSNNRFNGISPVKPALTFDYLRTGVYTLGVITTSMSRSKIPADQYYVVALFTPEEPKITRVKESTLQFKMPSPSSKLTKEKLVTGAVVTLTFADGTTITKDVAPKYFGHAVKWKNLSGINEKDFMLSLHWYYQTDENAVYDSPESKEVEWKGKPGKKKEEPKPVMIDEKKGYWKQVQASGNVQSKSIDESSIVNGLASRDLRGIELKKVNGENEVEFTGTACSKIKEDGKTLYQPETFLDGYISFTEPPKQWPANTNYTCEWYIAEDPFVKKMDNPFTFKVENTSSAPKACGQGKDKVTEKNSKTAKAKWLNQEKTVFKTNTPKKDDPRAFTIVQKFTISGGSNLDAVVFLSYDYEWVEGEPEEEEKEEETTPEGGHWKLVKIETDDSHKHFKAEDVYGDKNRTTATISGGSGNYSMHVDWWGAITNGKQFTGQNGFIYKINRQFHGGTPKQYYTPGKNFNLSWVSEELQAESLVNEMIFNAKNFDHYPVGSLSLLGYDSYLLRKNNNRIACDAKRTPDRMEMNLGVVPAKEAYPRGFVICEVVVLDYPSAAAPGCYINNYYIYEWVEDEPEEETAPEGGYWQLVKTEADDAHMTFTDPYGSKYVISGGAGQYHLHMDIAGEIYEKGSDGYYHEVGKGVIHTIDRDYAFETPKQYYREKETGPAMSESEETTTEITNGAGHNSTPYIWGSGGFRLEKLDYETTFPKKLAAINHYEYDMRKKGHEWSSNFSIPDHDMFYPDGFQIIQRVIISENCYFQKVYIYEWVSPKTEK